MQIDAAWRLRAACRGLPDRLFFAPNPAPALSICATCPVRERCLADALAIERVQGVAGVFGGLTAAERQQILGDRRKMDRLCRQGHEMRTSVTGRRSCPTCRKRPAA